MFKKIPVNVKIVFKLYLLSIAIFFAFRMALFLLNLDKLGEATFGEIIQAFIMGIRFDCVVTGYVIALPAIVLSVFTFIGKPSETLNVIFSIVLTILFTITFIVAAADIPFFSQFFDRFNITAFDWIMTGDLKFVIKMIIQEPSYWLLIIPIVITVFLFYYITKKIFDKTKTWEKGRYLSKTIFTVLLWGLIFIGIRGRLNEKSPIQIGTAYFCNNPLLNQLGLNPNFTLVRSWLNSLKKENKSQKFMDNNKAIAEVREQLNIVGGNEDFPIAREVTTEGVPNNYNVILVLMESMSLNKTAHGGNTNNYTPFLDSLMDNSLFFNNFYSIGTHTYCGLYGTLVSYPVIFRKMPMKSVPILRYNSLAETLRENNYSTVFFTTHDSQFDNMGGFMSANGFERIISQTNYPFEEVKTTLGVPDDFMFRFSIPIFNELSKKNKPFFATLLTASDHPPYYIPEYFKPRSKDLKEQSVEYADFALQRFIDLASKESWFDSTIFVFIADHGASLDADYPIPLSYFHIPLIFYMPNNIKPSVNESLASQMDVFPTIMGMLNIPYVNNSFGIDLQKETRPFTLLMSDDKYAVLNEEWLFINYPKGNQIGLYKYAEKDKTNYYHDYPELAGKMQDYAESNLQLSEYLLEKKETRIN